MFFMGNMVNGYIVKLYRNLPNQAAQLKIEHFDFLALIFGSGETNLQVSGVRDQI